MSEENTNETSDGDVTERITLPGKSRTPLILVAVIAAFLVSMVGVTLFLSDHADSPTESNVLAGPTAQDDGPRLILGFDLTGCTPDKRALENGTWTLRECAKPIIVEASE